jgi:predicted HicB family RNase H-like nuclease
MPISKDNTKMIVIVPNELKDVLTTEAKKEKRSLSNYVVTILEKRSIPQ